MSTKERDYAFEALAEVSGTDWNVGRGELNAALKSIREQSEIEDSYLLADEIHRRAKLYRAIFPDISLTPSALNKHWKRVEEETKPGVRYQPPPKLPESRLEERKDALQRLKAELWGTR